MFCEKCGTQNADDAKFCENCGNPLSGVVAESPIVEENPAGAENVPETENSADTLSQENNNVQAPVEEVVQPEVQNGFDTTAQPDVAATGNPAPAQKKKTPVKLIAGLCAGAVVLIAAIIAIILVVVNSKPTINLNDYVKVKTNGYDGYGSVEISIDWDAIEDKYGEDLKFTGDAKDKYGDLLELADPIDALKSNIKVGFDDNSKTTELKNGDKVKYKWNVNKDAQKFVKCKLEYKNSEYTVSGLKAAETFDAFEGVTVEFSGNANDGYADFSFNGSYIGRYDFDISQTYGLKNGDVIKVTLVNEDVQYYINNIGKVPEAFEKEFKVEGLQEYLNSASDVTDEGLDQLKEAAEETIKDALDDYDSSVVYDGLGYEGYIFASTEAGNGIYIIYSADVSSEDDEFTAKKVYYPVYFRNVLKAENSYTYDEDITIEGNSALDVDSYYTTAGYVNILKCYLDLTKFNDYYDKYEMVGLDEKLDDAKMITKLDDVDEAAAKDIIADAKARIEEYVKSEFNDECSVSDLKAVGEYFAYKSEAEDDDQYKNGYIVVYSGKVSNSEAEFKETTVYFPVIYYGLYSVGDEKLMVSQYQNISGNTNLGGGYSINGYTDGKEMYDSMINNSSTDYKWEMTKGLEAFSK